MLSFLPYILLLAQAHAPEIARIRGDYARIQRGLPHDARTLIDIQGFSTEGAQMTVFRHHGQVVMVRVNIYGESGKTSEEYYYRQGRLVFLDSRGSEYDRLLSGHVVKVEEGRFYFQGGHLIRWLDADHRSVPASSPRFGEEGRIRAADGTAVLRIAASGINTWEAGPQMDYAHLRPVR